MGILDDLADEVVAIDRAAGSQARSSQDAMRAALAREIRSARTKKPSPESAERLKMLVGLAIDQRVIDAGRGPRTRPPKSDTVARLLSEHRIAADAKLSKPSEQKCNCNKSGLSGQAIDQDPTTGLTTIKTADGGRFRVRNLSNAALIPGQRITSLTLPKGSQVGVANRANTRKRSR